MDSFGYLAAAFPPYHWLVLYSLSLPDPDGTATADNPARLGGQCLSLQNVSRGRTPAGHPGGHAAAVWGRPGPGRR